MLKKAISPLIATVILVAFTMVLGAIIMNFSSTSTNELTQKASTKIERGLKCSLDLSLKVLELDDRKYACYNRSGSDNFEVIVENQGTASAKGVRIFLLDFYDNIKTADVISPIGAHNRTRFNISIALADDDTPFALPPNKVVISPIIEYSSASVDICTDNRIEIEELEDCDQ